MRKKVSLWMMPLHDHRGYGGEYNEITFSCDRRRRYLRYGAAVSGVGLVLLGTRHNGCFGLGQIRQLGQRQNYCVARMRGTHTARCDVLHHVLHLTNTRADGKEFRISIPLG